MQPATDLNKTLDQLIECYQQQVSPLVTEYVEDWQSPIYGEVIDQDSVHWRAVKQQPTLDFSALEEALEIEFHPSVKDFFGRWYAGDLSVVYHQAEEHHPVSLLQVQAAEDGERLLENITGHILMKRKLKQPETIFIGMAEEADDLLLTIDNDSGAVGLEWIGKQQHLQLTDGLAQFLQCCSPNSGKTD